MSVARSVEALEELAHLAARLRDVAPSFETRFLERIFDAAARLGLFPESGRIVPEFGEPHLREVVVRPYRVLYSLGPDGVEVLAVFHGAMSLDE